MGRDRPGLARMRLTGRSFVCRVAYGRGPRGSTDGLRAGIGAPIADGAIGTVKDGQVQPRVVARVAVIQSTVPMPSATRSDEFGTPRHVR